MHITIPHNWNFSARLHQWQDSDEQWLRDNDVCGVVRLACSSFATQQIGVYSAVRISAFGIYFVGGVAWTKKSANHANDARFAFPHIKYSRLCVDDGVCVVWIHYLERMYRIISPRKRQR